MGLKNDGGTITLFGPGEPVPAAIGKLESNELAGSTVIRHGRITLKGKLAADNEMSGEAVLEPPEGPPVRQAFTLVKVKNPADPAAAGDAATRTQGD